MKPILELPIGFISLGFYFFDLNWYGVGPFAALGDDHDWICDFMSTFTLALHADRS